MEIAGPKLLNLETTTRCNGHCVYCVRHIIGSYDMPFEMYKAAIDAFPEAEQVWPHGIGEPLLYPHIVEAVEYATRAGMATILYTNGTLLDEKMGKALLGAGLTRMVLSVDAADPKTYAMLRPGLDFDRLVANADAWFKLVGNRVTTWARITQTPENLGQAGKIRRFWSQRSHYVWFRPEVYIPEQDFSPLWSHGKIQSCPSPHRHFTVRANGDVVLCCRDYWGHYKMGNLNEDNPVDVWESHRFQGLRKAMRTGRRYPHLCDVCTEGHQRHIEHGG